jgi:hypothetical protein
MHASSSLSLLILIGLGLSGSILPAQTGPRAPAPADPTFSAWLVSASPQPLCPGDRVAISVRSLETTRNVPVNGYPMNITQSSPALGHLDPVSKVVVNGAANFVYIANDGAPQGTQTDTLTFRIGGYPTGLSVPITVYASCNYRLTLFMEYSTQDESGMYLNELVNGELVLERAGTGITSQAHGEGSDEVFLDMGGSNQAFLCLLDPPIQGSGTFQADATFNPVTPGIETMSFDLIFDQVSMNSSNLTCASTLGMDIQASVPFDAGSWDPDEMQLQGLSVTLNQGYGSVEVAYKVLRGRVVIQREVKP